MEASADLATPAQEEAKPVRANRGSNISSSEPTVTSTRTESAEAEGEGKPKKAGWWQRRGFF
jgi:ribonuclease E